MLLTEPVLGIGMTVQMSGEWRRTLNLRPQSLTGCFINKMSLLRLL